MWISHFVFRAFKIHFQRNYYIAVCSIFIFKPNRSFDALCCLRNENVENFGVTIPIYFIRIFIYVSLSVCVFIVYLLPITAIFAKAPKCSMFMFTVWLLKWFNMRRATTFILTHTIRYTTFPNDYFHFQIVYAYIITIDCMYSHIHILLLVLILLLFFCGYLVLVVVQFFVTKITIEQNVIRFRIT